MLGTMQNTMGSEKFIDLDSTHYFAENGSQWDRSVIWHNASVAPFLWTGMIMAFSSRPVYANGQQLVENQSKRFTEAKLKLLK